MFGVFGNAGQPSLAIGTPEDWYYFQIPFGRGVLAGGLTLMLVILPVVIISGVHGVTRGPSASPAAMASRRHTSSVSPLLDPITLVKPQ